MEEKVYLDYSVEFKASKDEKGVIEGYASTFGNVDRQLDIVMAGAFAGGRTKVPIFGMHNPREGIGVGRVKEDEKGLFITIKLAVDNEDSEILRERAKEYYAMAKEGIIERMSIGFRTLDAEYQPKKIGGQEKIVRLIKKADLLEVSLVPIPANDLARITGVKSYTEDKLKAAVEAATKSLEERIRDLESKLEALKQPMAHHVHTGSPDISAIVAKRLGLF
ncbi:HK97 family phage prohead protease [Effusibacillus pohliae]|uniref:HK97 family phage prohead protease n=1 Tax=Effusibacillus pohliae TaxID=232270 RepID=UPI0003679332|nr:HK97 family phage prohead protease [Effusibacillus pohliae]